MNSEDKYWIFTCIRFPEDFVIVVDNDGVFVQNLKTGDAVHDFAHYGWRLALDLFQLLGCNAEEA